MKIKHLNALTGIFASLASYAQASRADPGKGPGTETFLSRPGQWSVKLNVRKNKEPKALGSGYIFTSPYTAGAKKNYGVQIYENSGELVFSGTYLQQVRAMDSHVCDYLGENTLCFTDAVPNPVYGTGHSAGFDRFFRNDYTQVGPNYGAAGNLSQPDAHELNTPANLHGAGFINDVFQPIQVNLTQYDGPANGWILSGCFQQRHIKTDAVQFQWCSNVHVPLDETFVYIAGNSAGNTSNPKNHGTKTHPWDYFHINAIDRDVNGDYYVSSRETHTIYKVAGVNNKNPGNIIWRLGGKQNEFKQKGHKSFFFKSQHDVRVQKLQGDETILSIFDNHTPRPTIKKKDIGSSGKYIRLNTKKMTAELIQEYRQPQKEYAPTGGQVQTLDNGNVFVGFGQLPSIAEYRPGNPGEAIYYATFNKAYQSYRSYKLPWVGKPSEPPTLFAYQRSCDASSMAIYMSWNGATEHTEWKVYGAQDEQNHNGTHLGNFKKTGYETVATIHRTGLLHHQTYKYIFVEAMGKKGESLGRSKGQEMFVPSKQLARTCGLMQCPAGTNYSSSNNTVNQC